MYRELKGIEYIMSRIRLNKSMKKSTVGTILTNHIITNKRGYLIVTILFFVGLIIGVFILNNTDNNKIEEINTYLNELATKVKTYDKIEYFSLLKESLISNFIIIILLWFGASTIIGIPLVYGTVLFKGFSFGYTISSIIACFGTEKGILISLSTMLLHNIIFIPSMLGASVSGLKLYQSIMKNKERNNIKMEILRHTVFCTFMLILMLISSILEIYVSTNLFIILLKKI